VRKAKRSLKAIVNKCTHYEALENALREAPPEVQRHILEQFASLLPNDSQARKSFVKQGCLQYTLTLDDINPELKPLVEKISDNFPAEIVNYYSPKYAKGLLDNLDGHQPSV
jgi:hypothetical protein